MKGEEVKKILMANGYKLTDVANAMGIIPQTLQSLLKADDIKTGVLENIAESINRNVYFFFGEEGVDKTSGSNFNFDKWMEIENRKAEAMQQVVANNTELTKTNSVLVRELLGAIKRIEDKVDKRGEGADDSSHVAPMAASR